MSLQAQRTPKGNIMEFTCMMLITSQCFHMYFFMAVVVWANPIFGSTYIAAFTPSFGSNCFYLDTLSGKSNHYLYTCLC